LIQTSILHVFLGEKLYCDLKIYFKSTFT